MIRGEFAALLDQAYCELNEDIVWGKVLSDACALVSVGVHLAVFVEPYLQYLLDGKKTVESRFSANRCAPYQRVATGDVIFLKKSGGPICGICRVDHVWDYVLDPSAWEIIKHEFGRAICAQDPSFWSARESASFATLMSVRHARRLPPMNVEKRDRRGWVVLKPSHRSLELFTCSPES